MCQADGTWLIQTNGAHHIQLSGSDIYKELCSVRQSMYLFTLMILDPSRIERKGFKLQMAMLY